MDCFSIGVILASMAFEGFEIFSVTSFAIYFLAKGGGAFERRLVPYCTLVLYLKSRDSEKVAYPKSSFSAVL